MADNEGNEVVIDVPDESNSELGFDDFPENDIVIDIDDGTKEPEVDPELLKMQTELEASKNRQAELQSQATQNELLAQALNKINANLSKDEKDEDTSSDPQIDLKAIIENVDKNLVLKPGETFVQALAPILQQMEQGYEKKLSSRDKELGKLKVYQNDEYKALYRKYEKEVDSVAKSYSGTDAYIKAIKEVQLNHADDIMADKLAGMKESLLAELKGELGQSGQTSQTSQTYTNANQNRNSGKRHIKITPQDLQLVKDYAFKTAGFFDLEDPSRLETAIDLAKSNGIIK